MMVEVGMAEVRAGPRTIRNPHPPRSEQIKMTIINVVQVRREIWRLAENRFELVNRMLPSAGDTCIPGPECTEQIGQRPVPGHDELNFLQGFGEVGAEGQTGCLGRLIYLFAAGIW